MDNKNKLAYLGKNTIIFAISSFGTKFLAFFLVPLYTNLLTTAEYGTADILSTTAILMSYIFTINIQDAVLRFALEKKKERDEIFAYGMRVLEIGSLALLLVAGITWWSNLLDWSWQYYALAYGYFFFTTLYQIMTAYLRAIDQVADVAKAGIVSFIVMVACNLLFLLGLKIGMYGYMLAQIFGPAVASGYAVFKIHQPVSAYFRGCSDTKLRSEMRSYSIPLIFNNISLWINAYLDKYFIAVFCGTAANGIYAVAGKIPTILSTCYTVFSMAWNISAIKEFDPEDNDRFIAKTYEAYNSLMVLACSVLILLNIPLAKLLYAKEFFAAWQYSSIMLIYIVFNALTAFLGSLFSALKKTKVIAWTTVIAATVNTVLNALLIPQFGVLGAAVATAICYAVMWAIRLVVIKRYVVLQLHIWKDVLSYAILSAQVVLEHFADHCYGGQCILLAVLLVLNRNVIFSFLLIIKNLLEKIRKGERKE